MSAKKTLLILDFDRTVFNLEKFLGDLQEHLWQLPSAPAEDSKTHQLFKNPQDYTDADRKRLEQAFRVLPAHDYTYDDVAPLLAQLPSHVTPVIMTRTFAEAYQYFKHRFTPAIERVPFHVILEKNKGEVIAGGLKPDGDAVTVHLPLITGKFDRAVLVDDNPKQFEPLLAAGTPIQLIHMNRPGEKYTDAKLPEGVLAEITSLAELPALLA